MCNLWKFVFAEGRKKKRITVIRIINPVIGIILCSFVEQLRALRAFVSNKCSGRKELRRMRKNDIQQLQIIFFLILEQNSF